MAEWNRDKNDTEGPRKRKVKKSDPEIKPDTNLTRKTDARSGYRHTTPTNNQKKKGKKRD